MNADVPAVVVDKPLSPRLLSHVERHAAKLDELSMADHAVVLKILATLFEARMQAEQQKAQKDQADRAQAAARERALAINQPTQVKG